LNLLNFILFTRFYLEVSHSLQISGISLIWLYEIQTFEGMCEKIFNLKLPKFLNRTESWG